MKKLTRDPRTTPVGGKSKLPPLKVGDHITGNALPKGSRIVGVLTEMLDDNPAGTLDRAARTGRLPAGIRVMPKLHLRGASGDFILPKPMAHTRVDVIADQGSVRIYKESPERAVLQIRSVGKISLSRKAVCRPSYSSVSLDAGDIAAIVVELLMIQAALREPEGAI